jgi:hypothetical protein
MSRHLQIVLSERAAGLVAEAAERAGCKSATWARQTLYAALRASGLDPTAMPSNGGADQDSWALVDDAGNVLGFGQFAAKPADDDRGTWLPLVYADAAPFDPDKHYRLAPEPPVVEAGKVVRRYPVIPKSLEAI